MTGRKPSSGTVFSAPRPTRIRERRGWAIDANFVEPEGLGARFEPWPEKARNGGGAPRNLCMLLVC
jgi:hypothetical protein